MKRKYNKGLQRLLISFLPLGFIVLACVWLFNYVSRRGLLGALGGLIGIEEPGSAKSKEESEKVVKNMSNDLAAKGVVVKNEFVITANQLFQLINYNVKNPLSGSFWSGVLPDDIQKQVFAVLLDYYKDGNATALKAILVAYGVRNASNRLSPALGILWDNAKGNLYDHLAWYTSKNLPADGGYSAVWNSYLNDWHPVNIRDIILQILKSENA